MSKHASWFRWLGLFAAFLFISSPNSFAQSATPPAAQGQRVAAFRLDGEIEPVMAEFAVGQIEEANRNGASLLLIELNTPGGLDASMREIISAVLHSQTPVAIYVSPTGARAASAGFFVLLSADVAAMAPGTDTGAASPLLVIGGSPVQIDETLRHKIVNEASAYLRSITVGRGRNAELAETAVTEAKAFTQQEALEGNLIDLVANSREELIGKLDGQKVRRFDGSVVQLALGHPIVEDHRMSSRQTMLAWIVRPDVFFILLIVGVLGLYVEFTHPGVFAPGVVGAIALVLAMFAMHLLPVSTAGLALIAVALALFLLEAKFPTHGVLGGGGIVAMVLGALLLVRSPLTGTGVSPAAALGVALPAAILVIVLMRLVMKSRRWKPATGRDELIGEFGEVRREIDGHGIVFVHGELWQAASKVKIPQGERVRVTGMEGLMLHVVPAGGEQTERAGRVPA
jgi:membrane-bound serine protease (ClpP class)